MHETPRLIISCFGGCNALRFTTACIYLVRVSTHTRQDMRPFAGNSVAIDIFVSEENMTTYSRVAHEVTL